MLSANCNTAQNSRSTSSVHTTQEQDEDKKCDHGETLASKNGISTVEGDMVTVDCQSNDGDTENEYIVRVAGPDRKVSVSSSN